MTTGLIIINPSISYSKGKNKCERLFIKNEKTVEKQTKEPLENEPQLTQVKAKSTLSKILRSNAPFFWAFFKKIDIALNDGSTQIKDVPKKFIKKLTSFLGIVMGDAHLGNIHVVPSSKNRNRLETKNIDGDDAGFGKLIYDFVHLVASIKSINKEVDLDLLINSYLKGLSGEVVEPPKFIQKLLKLKPEEFEKMREEKVAKKVVNDKFKLSEDLHAFNEKVVNNSRENINRIIIDVLQFSYKDCEILDLALLPVTSGGSANTNTGTASNSGTTRIWVLVKIENKNHIFEIKPMPEPGVNHFMEQPFKRLEIWQKAREFFDYADSDLAPLDIGGNPYYFREKKVTLFDVPYDQLEPKDLKRLKDLSEWGAYHLGQWHAKNEVGQEYSNFVNDKDHYEPLKRFVQFSRDKLFDEFQIELDKKIADAKEKKTSFNH